MISGLLRSIGLSDFAIVVVMCGALVVIGACLLLLEWRGFQQDYRDKGDVTISKFVSKAAFRSPQMTFFEGVVVTLAVVHFTSI